MTLRSVSPTNDHYQTSDGIDLSICTWPGDGRRPGILMVHATGFVKEVWNPVVSELRDRGVDGPCVAFDQRGHGDSDIPEPPYSWAALGRDVVALRDRLEGRWIGVGHSSGAAAVAMAEIASPGLFAALVLIEPIVLPPPHVRVDDHPLVLLALNRRYAFRDREAALANFAGKGPFAQWDARSLASYVDGGLRRDGDRLILKCHPTVEAEFYRMGGEHDTWDRLGAIDVPVAMMAGSASSTHPEPVVRALAERFRDPSVTVVEGATHFLPMERPDSVAAEVADLVTRV